MKDINLVIVIVALFLLGASTAFGAAGPVNENTGRIEDLRDFLVPVPPKVYQKYGFSETNRWLYNIVRTIEVNQNQEKRINKLTAQIEILEKQVKELQKQGEESKKVKVKSKNNEPLPADANDIVIIDPNKVAE